MPIQVRALRQKAANAISPGNVTDPHIMPKAPQVQESIRIANPSEEKKQVRKEACELLHTFKPSSLHKERAWPRRAALGIMCNRYTEPSLTQWQTESMKSEPRTQDFSILFLVQ